LRSIFFAATYKSEYMVFDSLYLTYFTSSNVQFHPGCYKW
jgi:hypothetical protein